MAAKTYDAILRFEHPTMPHIEIAANDPQLSNRRLELWAQGYRIVNNKPTKPAAGKPAIPVVDLKGKKEDKDK